MRTALGYTALGLLLAVCVLLVPPVIGALVYWIGQVWWWVMSALGVG